MTTPRPGSTSARRVPVQELAAAPAAQATPARAARRAFTLIELLVTMVIIAIIAAAILGTASAALDAARHSRTQTLVLRLHNLLMERWGSYETRRVDLSPDVLSNLDDHINAKIDGGMNPGEAARLRGQIMADLRLLAMRELMKIEMPDRWSDVLLNPVGGAQGKPMYLARRTSLSEAYLRQYLAFDSSLSDDTIRGNQGAECLYMIIMYGTGDGEAREQFTDQDIGDTDGDGAPEFLDGWGRPIGFIRWPAGFVSPLQPLNQDPTTGNLVRNPLTDHDPFDPFRRDSPAALPRSQQDYGNYFWSTLGIGNLKDTTRAANAGFALVPLIYSMGPDEDADLVVSPLSTGPQDAPLDPYGLYPVEVGDPVQLGRTLDLEDDGEGWHDNIHNHLLEY